LADGLVGGIIGVTAASVLENHTLITVDSLPQVAVAVGEEAVKLAAPLAVVLLRPCRRLVTGLLLGVHRAPGSPSWKRSATARWTSFSARERAGSRHPAPAPRPCSCPLPTQSGPARPPPPVVRGVGDGISGGWPSSWPSSSAPPCCTPPGVRPTPPPGRPQTQADGVTAGRGYGAMGRPMRVALVPGLDIAHPQETATRLSRAGVRLARGREVDWDDCQ
jgi:hypothetical protein